MLLVLLVLPQEAASGAGALVSLSQRYGGHSPKSCVLCGILSERIGNAVQLLQARYYKALSALHMTLLLSHTRRLTGLVTPSAVPGRSRFVLAGCIHLAFSGCLGLQLLLLFWRDFMCGRNPLAKSQRTIFHADVWNHGSRDRSTAKPCLVLGAHGALFFATWNELAGASIAGSLVALPAHNRTGPPLISNILGCRPQILVHTRDHISYQVPGIAHVLDGTTHIIPRTWYLVKSIPVAHQ